MCLGAKFAPPPLGLAFWAARLNGLKRTFRAIAVAQSSPETHQAAAPQAKLTG
jgi:hypothetical protein